MLESNLYTLLFKWTCAGRWTFSRVGDDGMLETLWLDDALKHYPAARKDPAAFAIGASIALVDHFDSVEHDGEDAG